MSKSVRNLCMNCKHLVQPKPQYLSAKHGLCDLSYCCLSNGNTRMQAATSFRATNCQGIFFEPKPAFDVNNIVLALDRRNKK